jgi:predicted DNA-binding transcriptional regulator YafY
MRADRLVAALLVLQARGRITAQALAEELEVSERTARRDLEGLALAGIPVYSQPGRGGGWTSSAGPRPT